MTRWPLRAIRTDLSAPNRATSTPMQTARVVLGLGWSALAGRRVVGHGAFDGLPADERVVERVGELRVDGGAVRADA